MSKANVTCKTCGKEYFFCSHCEKSLNSPQWMLMWHDLNCKKVFEIASDYVQKRISKSEARSRLKDCDMSVYYTFKENIRIILEEIMAEDKVLEPQVQERRATKKIARNKTRGNK